MDSNKINYDPAATVADTCYDPIEACLNPVARNYNCRARADNTCPELTPGTVHSQPLCKYKGEADEGQPFSPSPPAPLAPAGQTVIQVERVTFPLQLSMSVDDIAASMATLGPSIVSGMQDTLDGGLSAKELATIE